MATLIDVVETNIDSSEAVQFYYLKDGEVPISKTYAEVVADAKKLALYLSSRFEIQSTIILIYPPGLDFISSMLACFYSGMIAVPAYRLQNTRHAYRLHSIIDSCQPSLILGNQQVVDDLNQIESLSAIEKIATESIFAADEKFASQTNPVIDERKIAFLQYTSGSTGKPKGVMVSHGNLMNNLASLKTGWGLGENKTSVLWLPFQHDLGLIGGVLSSLHNKNDLVLLPPVSVIEKPYRWLKALMDYDAYFTAGPNFAFQLCVNKISEEELSTLDLSSVGYALAAAEPNRYETMRQFCTRFGVCGFKSEAYCVGYGLAENTLHVTTNTPNKVSQYINISKESLAQGKIQLPSDDKDNYRIVSGGAIHPSHEVVIVNPLTQKPCSKEDIGEIWVHGESVAQGYWNNEEATQETFKANIEDIEKDYLRTGDLGFIHENELYITGRLKDLIIIDGRNIYPQDLEAVVEASHEFIKPGCSAVFSVDTGKQEAIVVCVELKRTAVRQDLTTIIPTIRHAIASLYEVIVHDIKLLKPNRSFKTTSGKIQRKATKKAYLENKLECMINEEQSSTPKVTQIAIDCHRILAQVLELKEINLDQRFSELGGTSMHATLVYQKLQEYFGDALVISPTIAFDYPTLGELIEFAEQALNRPKELIKGPERIEQNLKIAIVGIGCRLPGNVRNIDDLWHLLKKEVDAIEPIPEWRWDISQYEDELKNRINHAGIIKDIDHFDASFFNISPKEAKKMDPQHRILLEVIWEALEHAAISPLTLNKEKVGIYMGSSSTDYKSLISKHNSDTDIDPYFVLDNASSVLAGRVAYYLGTQGPAETIDTACSSSLVALDEACQGLQLGRTKMAIAGGINVILYPENSVGLAHASMLSPTNRCHPFSQDADGYVRAEGCAVVVLKRLDDALNDGDMIHAVIQSTAVNQDGASSGLTVPSLKAQQQLIQEALSQANLTPNDIDYIEAFASGTVLGDPIEFGALNAVFADQNRQRPLYVGSIKSNLGHCEAAAGITGLIKTIAALTHKELPATIHLNKMNNALDLNRVPIEIVRTHTKWHSFNGGQRRAGISSFGFSGTNAHVILEEAPALLVKDKMLKIPEEHLFVLSAKTQKSLEMLVQSYINYLAQSDEAIEDICYTATIGRSHFKYRLALVVKDKSDLLSHLKTKAYQMAEVAPTNEVLASTDLNALAAGYLSGKPIKWAEYYKPYLEILHKVSLPTYCFDTQRYWLDYKEDGDTPPGEPLLLRQYQPKNDWSALLQITPVNKRHHILLDKIKGVLAQILDNPEPNTIEENKSFFELGMDSLMIMELNTKIQNGLGAAVSIQMKEIMEQASIELLTQLLISRINWSAKEEISGLETGFALIKAPKQSVIIATEGQKRLFYLSDLYPKSYNLGVIYTVNELIDFDLFAEAIQHVFAANPIYKINYLVLNNELYQVVDETKALQPMVYTSDSDTDLNYLKQLIYHPYDLSKDNLFRFALSFDETTKQSYFVFACHHTISDLVSMNMLINEIYDNYYKLKTNNPLNETDPERFNYFDYSTSCSTYFSSSAYQPTREYWLKKISGFSKPTSFLKDKCNPSNQLSIQKLNFDLDKELVEEILAFSKANNSSVFNIIYTSFLIFLYKYTSNEDVAIGLATHGREYAELNKIHGFFTKIVPVRVLVNPEMSGSQFLDIMYRINQEDVAHQPFDLLNLLSYLKPANVNKGIELFKLLFNFNSASMQSNGSNFKLVYSEEAKANYEMGFSWHQRNKTSLTLEIKYNEFSYSKEYIKVLCRQYFNFIHSFIQNSSQRLADFSLIDNQEELILKKMAQGSSEPMLVATTCMDLFDTLPNDLLSTAAIIEQDTMTTYEELDNKSNQIAFYLIEQGIKKGAIVSIILERSADLIISMMGVLKSGAAFVLIDPRQPLNRIQYIVADCDAKVILTNELGITTFNLPRMVTLKGCLKFSKIHKNDLLNPSLDDLAYICYTSGSTGQPKGVMITHRGLVNMSHYYKNTFSLTAGIICGQYSSVTFDAAIGEIMPALISGATVVITPEAIKTDISALCEFLDKYKINHLFLPTAIYALMQDYSLPYLRTLIVAGERLDKFSMRQYRLFNAYGPTENTVCATLKELQADEKISIGKPNANVQAYIVDKEMNLTPLGAPGELVLGGFSLASGYLNSPEKTHECFVENPFDKSTKLYKTGDICRWLPDGNIEYIGRDDFQIKIRGVRIELGEIDATLQGYAEVRQAVSIVRKKNHDQQIISFVQPESGFSRELYDSDSTYHETWIKTLLGKLRSTLPAYMLPAHIEILEKMPLTINGKIDRTLLTAKELHSSRSKDYEAPRSDMEKELLVIWSQILKVDSISIHDNFFDLGGHSLNVAELKLKINLHFSRAVQISDLYINHSIKAQAELLEENRQSFLEQLIIPLAENKTKPPLFLIHPVSGKIACYYSLAKDLSQHYSVYAIQSTALVNKNYHQSIQDMATDYINHITSIQNKGPYLLMGWSMGGILAHEIASQLTVKGDQSKVIMLDSYLPEYMIASASSNDLSDALIIRLFVNDLKGQLTPEIYTGIEALFGIETDQFETQLIQYLDGYTVALEVKSLLIEQWRVYQANQRALNSYSPSPSSHTVMLFHGNQSIGDFIPPDTSLIKNYWCRYVLEQQFKIIVIEANHMDILSELRVLGILGAVGTHNH